MSLNGLEQKKINLGISLLRFLLCIWVVIYHCSKIKAIQNKYLWKGFHVPTFVLISFYFYYHILSKRTILRIILRFERLLIPYVFWPLLIFLLNNILNINRSLGQFDKKITLKSFFIQILFGVGYHSVFWFQFNLIFLSLSFTIISFVVKKNLLLILSFIGILSLYLNLSEKNYIFFKNMPFKSSLGALIELIPLSVVGCLFSSIHFIIIIKRSPFYFRIILFIFIYFLFEYDIFISQKGFRYPNVILNIFASTILMSAFSSIDFKKEFITKIIGFFTQFTGGIYYIHMIIRDYLRKYISLTNKKPFLSSFVIYIISFGICFLGGGILKKNKFKYIFI